MKRHVRKVLIPKEELDLKPPSLFSSRDYSRLGQRKSKREIPVFKFLHTFSTAESRKLLQQDSQNTIRRTHRLKNL